MLLLKLTVVSRSAIVVIEVFGGVFVACQLIIRIDNVNVVDVPVQRDYLMMSINLTIFLYYLFSFIRII